MSIAILTTFGIPYNVVVHGSEMHTPAFVCTDASDNQLYTLPSIAPPDNAEVMVFNTDGSSAWADTSSFGPTDALLNPDLTTFTAGQVIISSGGAQNCGGSVVLSTNEGSKYVAITNGADSLHMDVDGSNNAHFTNCSSYIYDNIISGTGLTLAGDLDLGYATASSALYLDSSKHVQSATLTNGQLLIGHSGSVPSVASLTAGANITITPGAGTITIASSGGGSANALLNSVPTVPVANALVAFNSTDDYNCSPVNTLQATPYTLTVVGSDSSSFSLANTGSGQANFIVGSGGLNVGNLSYTTNLNSSSVNGNFSLTGAPLYTVDNSLSILDGNNLNLSGGDATDCTINNSGSSTMVLTAAGGVSVPSNLSVDGSLVVSSGGGLFIVGGDSSQANISNAGSTVVILSASNVYGNSSGSTSSSITSSVPTPASQSSVNNAVANGIINITTSDDSGSVILTIPFTEDRCVLVNINLVGRAGDVSGCFASSVVCLANNGGTSNFVSGSPPSIVFTADTELLTVSANWSLVSQNLTLTVVGVASTFISWSASYSYFCS